MFETNRHRFTESQGFTDEVKKLIVEQFKVVMETDIAPSVEGVLKQLVVDF